MTSHGAQIAPWLFWGMLLVGAALVGFGLLRDIERFWQWRWAQAGQDGEIILGDGSLAIGQNATITSEEPSESVERPGALPSHIVAIGKKTITLALEGEPTPAHNRGSDRSASDQSVGWPRMGATAVVHLTGTGALYRFMARVQDVRFDPDNARQRLLMVTRPKWLVRIQRRQFARVPMALPITFEPAERRTVDHEAGDAYGQEDVQAAKYLPLHGTLVDLSGGGLRAVLGDAMGANRVATLLQAFAPGVVLRVRLPLPALSDTPLLARVKTSERMVTRGGLSLRLACEFLPMASYEQELIVHHLFRVQREQLQARFRPDSF